MMRCNPTMQCWHTLVAMDKMPNHGLLIICGLLFVNLSLCAKTMPDESRNYSGHHPAPYIEVFQWLRVGESKLPAVAPSLQEAVNQGAWMEPGTFAYTGGPLRNLGDMDDIARFPGARVLSIGFDRDNLVDAVTVLFMKSQIETIIAAYTERFAPYAPPLEVFDHRGENRDRYILFELAPNYIAEIADNQHGTFASATFATRATYEHMRSAERKGDLLFPYLNYWQNHSEAANANGY